MTRPDDPGADDEAVDRAAGTAERTEAAAFGRRLEAALAGRALPPALDADQRELIETAVRVAASTRLVELGQARRDAIVERALELAISGGAGGPDRSAGRRAAGEPPAAAAPGAARAVSEAGPATGGAAVWTAPRRRFERALPWAVAGLAAAAAVVALARRPEPERVASRTGEATAERLPVERTSRPADRLIGRIPRAEVGDARARIDAIWSDRLAGFRAAALGGDRR